MDLVVLWVDPSDIPLLKSCWWPDWQRVFQGREVVRLDLPVKNLDYRV